MKIVQVIPQFTVGGAEIMCEELTYALRAAGHTVVVASLYNGRSPITERLEAAGVDIRYLGKRRGPDPFVLHRLCKLLRQERPDAVHSHLYASEYAVPAAVLAGVRCRVHTLHSIAKKENGRVGRLLNRAFFHFFGLVPVALSDLVRDTVVEEYHLKPEKVPVVLNGIDLSRCCEKQGYDRGEPFVFLHIGRFAPVKNQMGLLRAFAAFRARYGAGELWLIGDGELRTSAEEYVAENGLQDCVRFLGIQENVCEFLHRADVFVLPSLYEGVPMTLIEAMGSALPIVATAVGGVPNMLDDGCALLIPPTDAAIENALGRYYEEEPLRRAHGRAALARAPRFSAAAMAQRYEEVYRL